MRDVLYRKYIRKWFKKQIDAEVLHAAMFHSTYIEESNVRKGPDFPNFPPAVWHPSKVIIPEPGDQIVPQETSEEEQ